MAFGGDRRASLPFAPVIRGFDPGIDGIVLGMPRSACRRKSARTFGSRKSGIQCCTGRSPSVRSCARLAAIRRRGLRTEPFQVSFGMLAIQSNTPKRDAIGSNCAVSEIHLFRRGMERMLKMPPKPHEATARAAKGSCSENFCVMHQVIHRLGQTATFKRQ